MADGDVLRDENGGKQAVKRLSYFCFYIFSGNGPESEKKTELKTDRDIRKYGNRQIRMESKKFKLE